MTLAQYKWEKWQNFFWKKKKTNVNADRGLEEFLKWIKIVEITKANSSKTIQSQEAKIKEIKDKPKISIEGLSLSIIENYFKALSILISFENELAFNHYWLAGASDARGIFAAIDYLKLLPALMYAEKYADCTEKDIQRFARFFQNISRFATLSKNPFESLVGAISLTKLFLDASYTDVSNLIELKDSNSYENILTNEEVLKLGIYKQSEENIRTKIEKAFWTTEDYKLCDGRVWFVWFCMDYEPSTQTFDEHNLNNFSFVFENFKSLFDSVNDLLRRALLTKGDYSVWDGRTATLDGNRYSFINSDTQWKQQLTSSKIAEPYKLLINNYGQIKTQQSNFSKETILNKIIADFVSFTTERNWIYYFIKEPNVFSYCEQKFVCFQNGESELNKIALLAARNAAEYNWTWLKSLIIIET